MAASTSASSANYLFTQSHSRKLLFHSPLLAPPTAFPQSRIPAKPVDNSFDANVVMVLSVLLCALICSLGLNSIIRCALRCSSLVSSDDQNLSARLTNTGIKKKALKTFLTVNYTAELNLPGLHTECAICLSEFGQGEKVRVLPKCSHAFHVRCIDKWLNSHSSCPTCRHCLIETCQRAKQEANCGSQAIPEPESLPAQESLVIRIPSLEHEGVESLPAQESLVIRIAPLEHEGVVRSHH